MAAGPSSAQRSSMQSRTYFWFQRNGHRLLAANIACIMLLFFMHLFTSTIRVFTPEVATAFQLAAIAPAVFIALSVVWKGVVPLIICVLGIVLMHNSVVLPYFQPESGEATVGSRLITWTYFTPMSVSVGSSMNFFLGLCMVAFSIIIAYRPSVLFTRNRPESLDDEWSKYPLWQDNVLLAGGSTERSVSVKSLMTDEDRYLLWRYEYVLAVVHGTPHLVRPDGLVPGGSTIVRDGDSGRVLGKPRYTGFFT